MMAILSLSVGDKDCDCERESGSMELASFLGRAMFVSVFLLSVWQEFNDLGDDGGRSAKSLKPKFNAFVKHVTTHTGQQVPTVDLTIKAKEWKFFDDDLICIQFIIALERDY